MKNMKKIAGGGAKRLAFTLAEVLITLAIIGVVAALTIPAVMAKYNQHAQYTQFMKMYNTLQNMFQMARNEFGEPKNWSVDENNLSQTSKTYIYPYLKISEICEKTGGDKCTDYNIKSISGGDIGPSSDYFAGNGLTAFLDDGSIVNFTYVPYQGRVEFFFIYFDTNGKKGPNVLGRDIFVLIVGQTDNGWRLTAGDDNDPDFGPADCNTQSGSGAGCSAKLLKEGKMNY